MNDSVRNQFARLAIHIAAMKIACTGLSESGDRHAEAVAADGCSFRVHLVHARALLNEIERAFQRACQRHP
jgi:hypothetical protein